MVTLYSQPFKIFLILRYYGIYTADQLTRHNVTLCMGAPLVFINITHTHCTILKECMRRYHFDFLI